LIRGLRYTGSVNQYGQIQAIGGVNEKIEGFYDICEQKALMESRVLSSHVPTKRI
jgi:predicted ATP-dependent protease